VQELRATVPSNKKKKNETRKQHPNYKTFLALHLCTFQKILCMFVLASTALHYIIHNQGGLGNGTGAGLPGAVTMISINKKNAGTLIEVAQELRSVPAACEPAGAAYGAVYSACRGYNGGL
jgi:hypothetical protein